MAKNKKRFKIVTHIITTVLTLAVGVVLMCSSQRSVSAAPGYGGSELVVINDGFNYGWQFFNTSYNVTNSSTPTWGRDYSYIDFRYDVGDLGYAYEVISFTSDSPRISSVYICLLCDPAVTGVTFWDRVIECGFYNGPSPTNFDKVTLPYYLGADHFVPGSETAVVCCLDISDSPIEPEGNLYFVVRYTDGYRLRYSYYNRPQVMFWNYGTSSTYQEGYNAGLDTGFNRGKNYGYSIYYQNGYDAGYRQGLSESSADYGIHDLLFSIFDTPFEVLTNVFSFTIFGAPVWTIISSLLAILLTLWVIKRFLR